MPPALDRKYRPEIRLLLLCARTRLPASASEAIQKLLEEELDWDFLLEQAARHGVSPLLERHLSPLPSTSVPAPHLARLQSLSQAAVAKSLLLTAELVRIDSRLRAANLTPLPYKGPVLAQQAYGSVGLRQFDDLDIILPHRDLPAAHKILLDLRYEPKFFPALATQNTGAKIPGEYKYFEATRAIIVELHTELTLRHFPRHLNFDSLARTAIPVPLTPNYSVQTFAPQHALPILCVHGAKDFWDRLSWIADLAELLRAFPQLAWDDSFAFAESLRAERMLHIGLLLAHNILDAPLPLAIMQRLQRDTSAGAVAAEIEARLGDEAAFALGSPLARLNYRRRMVSGLLSGCVYASRLAFSPTVEEWQPVPSGTSDAYPAARPLRHLKKHRS